MTIDCKIKNLKPGDIVCHKSGVKNYIVTNNYGNRVTAVLIADITNEQEWVQIVSQNTKLK